MRIFIIALAVLYWAGASLATSIVIGPAKCPAKVDLTPLAAGNAEAPDLNSWRQAADEIAPVVDIKIANSPHTDRVFARFRADPQTGETFTPRTKLCGE